MSFRERLGKNLGLGKTSVCHISYAIEWATRLHEEILLEKEQEKAAYWERKHAELGSLLLQRDEARAEMEGLRMLFPTCAECRGSGHADNHVDSDAACFRCEGCGHDIRIVEQLQAAKELAEAADQIIGWVGWDSLTTAGNAVHAKAREALAKFNAAMKEGE